MSNEAAAGLQPHVEYTGHRPPLTPSLAQFSLHGITFSSEIRAPDLVRAQGAVDARIRRAVVPRHLRHPVFTGPIFEAAPQDCLLRIEGVGAYRIVDGEDIAVDVGAAGDHRDLQAFLFGPAMTVLLQQRGVLVLHAGAIVDASGATLIAGHSGRGKSTLIAALAKRGCAVLGDDSAAVFLDRCGNPVVHPGLQQVKLWGDAVVRLGHHPSRLRQIRGGIEKYALPVPGADALPHRITRMIVLDMHSGGGVRVQPLADSEKFAEVRAFTRNARMLAAIGALPRFFEASARLAAHVPMWKVSRPVGQDSVDEMADVLLTTVR